MEEEMMQLRNPGTVVCIASIWGLLWAALALIVGTIIGSIDPSQIDPGEAPIVLAPIIGLGGFVCGLAFGTLAPIPVRGDRIVEIPLRRVVLWGIGVAVTVPVLTGKVIPEVLIIAPLGALSAMVSVAIARRSVQSG